jgi:transposase
MKEELTDAQGALLAPLLPPPKQRGRKRADDRATLNGILFVLQSGCRWKDVPRRYGAPTTTSESAIASRTAWW